MNKSLIFVVMLFLLSSTVLAVSSTQANPDVDSLPVKMLRTSGTQDISTHCYNANESYAVYHNGLWWAWLAPVATLSWDGYNITPDASLMGDGWRNVADNDEWALRPPASAFGQTKCAAETFFIPAPFCNWGDPDYVSWEYPNGAVTYYIDNTVSEFWVVHDDCGLAAYCGDGIVNSDDEECDDGNDYINDECSNTCMINDGGNGGGNDPITPSAVTGTVTYANGSFVIDAYVEATCNDATESTNTNEFGDYFIIFTSDVCGYGSPVSVTATKDDVSGTNNGFTCESAEDCEIPVALVDVTIPEFGVIAGAIALIAGLGIIVYRRK